MQLKTNAFALLAVLLPLTAALSPADPKESTVKEVDLEARQTQYQCHTQPAHQLGACNNAITQLRGLESGGCDVAACIGAFAAVIPACGAAIDEFLLNPIADLACIGAVANFQGPCANCEPW